MESVHFSDVHIGALVHTALSFLLLSPYTHKGANEHGFKQVSTAQYLFATCVLALNLILDTCLTESDRHQTLSPVTKEVTSYPRQGKHLADQRQMWVATNVTSSNIFILIPFGRGWGVRGWGQ